MLLRSQPQLSLYMALAPEEKLKYPLGGPAALEAFNGGKEGFEARSFRGLGVFVSTPYEVSDGEFAHYAHTCNSI